MEAFKNIGLNDFLKRYGLKNAFFRGLFLGNKIHYVSDYEQRKILWYKKTSKRLRKKYFHKRMIDPNGIKYGNLSESEKNPVWVYWKQGMQNAPDVVQVCYQSLLTHSSQPVILVTDENVNQFVELPEQIIKKHEAGNISTATYSDLLRFSLLEHFGGTWIDSTVLLTGDIPCDILESDFFAYRDFYSLMENPALYANWFMHCKPGNQIMKEIRNISFAYWEDENYISEYLWLYVVITMVIEDQDNIRIPYLNSDYAGLIFQNLEKPFCQEEFNYIRKLSPIHKLSYKLKEELVKREGTYYSKLIQDKRNENK